MKKAPTDDSGTIRDAKNCLERLLSQTQLFDDCTVAIDVLLLQVAQKVSSVTDHLQHTAAGVVILGVLLEVFVQFIDTSGQNRDLYFGRAGVGFVGLVGSDDCLLGFLVDHGCFTFQNCISQNAAHGR